ncbi:MAG: hypothetical protein PHY43_11465 [Verrucomicrobiales bacterium]|nr:hypothetical protein [Verrucomicrobiales bacterium]
MIGIDISPTACRVMAKRRRDVCGLPERSRSGALDALQFHRSSRRESAQTFHPPE